MVPLPDCVAVMVRDSKGELKSVVFNGLRLLVFATVREENLELFKRVRVVKRRREDMKTKKCFQCRFFDQIKYNPDDDDCLHPLRGNASLGITGSCPSMTDDGPVRHSPVF